MNIIEKNEPMILLQTQSGMIHKLFLGNSLILEASVNVEKFIENLMYKSRWLLAPIYLGLSLAVIGLAVMFFREVVHMMVHIFTMSEADMILIVLTLIDLAMVGGLLVMVMMSGYENFVSQLDIDDTQEKLTWLGKMDSASLKAKIAASIVAISSIHLLKVFMDAKSIDNDKLMWYVLIHLAFVLSAFLMGYLDKLAKNS